ncbi:hypothetical protein V9T40_006372 [Parthenolecanium corni]|uniref:Serine hydrolase domain-containing protein n=1 Tax=Parthenolecanium corni TaxID=536013 RepID=A0AAN9TM50_9HEMI
MDSSAKKTRILCLHGYRQSAKTFKEKLGAFRKLLKNEAEFIFLDAPHVVNGVDEERSWWFTNDDLTFSSKEISQVSIGFDESVTKVKTVYSQEGPFDGLLGFSQGAAFAATLCALMNSDFHFSFVILVAGFKSLVPPHSHFYNNIFNLPSLHVIGKSDAVIPRELSEELAEHFQSKTREVFYHEGGHFVPANKLVKQSYVSFIQKF